MLDRDDDDDDEGEDDANWANNDEGIKFWYSFEILLISKDNDEDDDDASISFDLDEVDDDDDAIEFIKDIMEDDGILGGVAVATFSIKFYDDDDHIQTQKINISLHILNIIIIPPTYLNHQIRYHTFQCSQSFDCLTCFYQESISVLEGDDDDHKKIENYK